MPYARADDLEMYYEEHGLPNATPMVLLHGFTATGASTWVQQREAFGKSYRLIVPDWRGHGRTANPSGGVQTQTQGTAVALRPGRRISAAGRTSGHSIAPMTRRAWPGDKSGTDRRRLMAGERTEAQRGRPGQGWTRWFNSWS